MFSRVVDTKILMCISHHNNFLSYRNQLDVIVITSIFKQTAKTVQSMFFVLAGFGMSYAEFKILSLKIGFLSARFRKETQLSVIPSIQACWFLLSKHNQKVFQLLLLF